MNKIPYLLLIIIIACNPQTRDKNEAANNICGNWSFLDGQGNYNEAYFSDSTYITFNLKYGASPYFSYIIKNDSLYSNIDKRKTGLNRIAEFTWLNVDKVILVTEFSRDTLDRIRNAEVTLQNTDLTFDSLLFGDAIKKRYEDFLVTKGVLTKEEIEQFNNDSIIPQDVKELIEE